MKIAISNIAWDKTEDKEVAQRMRDLGVGGLEIAPTKVWDRPADVSPSDAALVRRFWEGRGIKVVAFQALLFGHPELTIFVNEETREKTKAYLSKIIHLSSQLGAKALVFGSPKNRRIGELGRIKAWEIAVDFFRSLGQTAKEDNVFFCIEPNPPSYGADFITNTKEAVDLVRRVDHPNFRLHLDTGIMTINQEDYRGSIELGLPYLSHFHISEPNLVLIGEGGVPHEEVAGALRTLGYKGFVSVEMRDNLLPSNIEAVKRALDLVCRVYR